MRQGEVHRPYSYGQMSSMPFANLTLRATASGLEDEQVIAAALGWLVGDDEAVVVERTKSWHGSPMHLVSLRLSRRGDIRRAMTGLGVELLSRLMSGLPSRMDEDNAIHFRLDLDALVCARLVLCEARGPSVVKGRLKLRTFPGQEPVEVARAALREVASKAGTPAAVNEQEE